MLLANDDMANAGHILTQNRILEKTNFGILKGHSPFNKPPYYLSFIKPNIFANNISNQVLNSTPKPNVGYIKILPHK